MPRSAGQRIDLVAKLAQQVVPAQFPIRLHVADRQLDGVPPLQLFLCLRSDPRRRPEMKTSVSVTRAPSSRDQQNPVLLADR